MSNSGVLLIRHQSAMRVVGEKEALASLTDEEQRAKRRDVELDSRILIEDVEGGYWRSSDAWVRQQAVMIRTLAQAEGLDLHHFGLGEVPHVIGLGAHVGDELLVAVHDFHAEGESPWEWPEEKATLAVEASELPKEPVRQAGETVLIVEVSFPIDQLLVDSVVGTQVLANVRIRPAAGRQPAPRIVQSAADVQGIREKVREALAALRTARPNSQLLHLFVAAPPSVCFAVGQELRLRNGIDVQTYRYRRDVPESPYKPALLLTTRGLSGGQRPLTESEKRVASGLRVVCRDALADVLEHARRLRGVEGEWFAGLEPQDQLLQVKPFRSLASLATVVHDEDRLDEAARAEDYEFSKETRSWKLSDALVLALHSAANNDTDRMRELLRLFFYHEYLHDWQVLTKYTAEDVGSFANCLEAIDYRADVYALLHALDFAVNARRVEGGNPGRMKSYLKDLIALAVSSFWAFEPPPPEFDWQERRLRRYLNWYLRRVQVRDAADLAAAIRLLAVAPNIEVAGLEYKVGRGRHFVVLNRVRPGDRLEIGLVLPDGRFMRLGSTTDLSIEEAMTAFGKHDREAIDRFFNSLNEHLRVPEPKLH